MPEVFIKGLNKTLVFPDNMSQEQIASAIQKNFPELHKPINREPDFSAMGPEGEKLESFLKSGHPAPTSEVSTITGKPTGRKYETPRTPVTAKTIAERDEKLVDYPLRARIADAITPTLKLVGGTLAGIAATPESLGAGTVPAFALGYGAGGQVGRLIRGDYKGLKREALGAIGDVAEGAMTEMAGPIYVKIFSPAMKAASEAMKSAMGKLTGTGKAAIEEAIKSGKVTGLTADMLKSKTDFDRALRGEYQPSEIVDNAYAALTTIKQNRSNEYREALASLKSNTKTIDIPKLKNEIDDIFRRYVRFDRSGKPDWSRSALGPKGSEAVNKMEKMYKNIKGWKTSGEDASPLGLDMLKRQLDDFFVESSNSRALTTALRNKVKKTLVDAVPEYASMTKNYSNATSMIKDIEAGLMMRKQGMTGRITADQTLRRLSSALKDNFELRKDLVKVLGSEGSQDLTGQVAGYLLSPAMPRGIRGATMAGEAALIYAVNPKFWPVLAASSPRVSGEFLRLFGKALKDVEKTGKLAGRTAATGAFSVMNKDKKEEGETKE